MKRKFELGQTVYAIYNHRSSYPEIVESTVNEIRTIETNGREGKVDYSLSNYLYSDGDNWYTDKKEAVRLLLSEIKSEITKSEQRKAKLEEVLKAVRVLYDTDEKEGD